MIKYHQHITLVSIPQRLHSRKYLLKVTPLAGELKRDEDGH